MSAVKLHLSKISQRPGVTVTGTLCNRLRTLSDGMNCTDDRAAVTCKFCARILAALSKAEPTR